LSYIPDKIIASRYEATMLDIKLIRKNPKEVEIKLRTKQPEADLGEVLRLDEVIREKKTRTETLKAERNKLSEQIAIKKRAGEETATLMGQVSRFHDEMHAIDHDLITLEEKLQNLLGSFGNLPMDDIRVSQDPKENVCLRSWGERREFSFPFKNHLELNEKLHLFDFARAAKVSGSGFPAYCGMGARLEWALIQYMIDFHTRDGFIQWIPPLAVKRSVMFGAGQLPKFEGQQYLVRDDEGELFLIPTAEVVLCGLHSEEIFPEEVLPLKYIAYTPCFRREAGGAGTQERGLIRMHQFNKVEMFAFSTPESSGKLFDELVGRAETICQNLELHFRSMLLVTGDMSFASARTIDIEVWLPGQNRYYEVSSVSNCTDYQSRRSGTRFRRKGGKPELVHTLNGSGLATSRLMVAILENNQQADGSVIIPKVLRPYLGGCEKLEPPERAISW
jgi:seryl-tRNA synthetase